MTRLAIDGGQPAVAHPLRPYNSIGPEEVVMATAAIRSGPLSGYLGGESHGGLRCEALEHEFSGLVGSQYAVAVNSATSGLLIACMAVGVGTRSEVVTTPFTMSATAAAPAFLGAKIVFNDIEPKTYNLDGNVTRNTKAVILANIFGHPAHLKQWAAACRASHIPLIEDCAQAIFATEGGKYAGTFGDIGVFSFNVHKHLQCGEGGIVTTNDGKLADRLRRLRNHSELFDDSSAFGLNLRMTEPIAAIVLSQLNKRERLIEDRIELAESLTNMAKDIPGILVPTVREGCKHVYYMWSLKLDHDRDWFVRAMNAEGVPLKCGYTTPLYRLPAFIKHQAKLGMKTPHCPVTDELHDRSLVTFENCAYDPSREQLKHIRDAFHKVGEMYSQRIVNGTMAAE